MLKVAPIWNIFALHWRCSDPIVRSKNGLSRLIDLDNQRCEPVQNVLYCEMINAPHSPSRTRRLTPTEWSTIVDLYEFGDTNQRQLAERFGVTSAAIQKGLKKRGAIKGRRVGEHPALIHLKRELRVRWRAKQAAEAASFERMNERTAFVAALTEMLLRADSSGTLDQLPPLFSELRRGL
ncbi:hypothetical protein [Tsuneonella troitsensis]|uniref:hypothetical protein n=1 Tax=Tsuneonella troitsensis TaxID=292222 RepID=UPI00128EBFF3|nr:hypothetical protein [Tsuneonella troitsensis]